MKGFETSTDYKALYSLIQEGVRVPAWIIYTNEYKEPVYDLVEVKLSYMSKKWDIGTRGRGYGGFDDSFEAFEVVCKNIELQFIKPTKII